MNYYCMVLLFVIVAAEETEYKVAAETEAETEADTEDKVTPAICKNIKSKEEWGGRVAQKVDYISVPTEFVIIHHTDTQTCETEEDCMKRIRKIQNHHMDDLEYNDIGYNFLVGGDGNIYEGAGWHKRGNHTKRYNRQSIGIAFIGNFDETMPTIEQLQAAKDLLQCGVDIGELHRTYRLIGARQIGSSSSPGEYLYKQITGWIHFIRDAHARYGPIKLQRDF